jgi:hypothetical protein
MHAIMKHKVQLTQTRADARAAVSETVAQSRSRQLIRAAVFLNFGLIHEADNT